MKVDGRLKKGFTLVELLAVIIVLGVILLVTVPKVKSIINDSKEEASKRSIELFIRELNNKIFEKKLKGNFAPEICSVEDGAVICDGELLFTEKNKINGVISIDSGDISYYSLKINKYSFTTPATDEGCFSYTGNNYEVTITGYRNYVNNDSNNDACPRDVVIPEKIDGKTVDYIGNSAMYNKNLTSVIIPDTVTYIDYSAFRNNNILKVIIGNKVRIIDQNAFQQNNIKDIYIGNRVVSIGYNAFYTNKISNLIIPDSVESIGYGAFSSNSTLTTVRIGSGIKNIGSQAFTSTGITSFIIDAHRDDVTLSNNSGAGASSVCWLKDNPTCE